MLMEQLQHNLLLRCFVGLGMDDAVRAPTVFTKNRDRLLEGDRVVREDAVARRLVQIPGVGVITATALIGAVGHIHAFRRGRHFASWLGLTPRESSSGGRRRLGGISK